MKKISMKLRASDTTRLSKLYQLRKTSDEAPTESLHDHLGLRESKIVIRSSRAVDNKDILSNIPKSP